MKLSLERIVAVAALMVAVAVAVAMVAGADATEIAAAIVGTASPAGNT
jgi:hypothetical protein